MMIKDMTHGQMDLQVKFRQSNLFYAPYKVYSPRSFSPGEQATLLALFVYSLELVQNCYLMEITCTILFFLLH